MALSSAHLSEILDALARRGLVHSRRLASDRRRQVWQASPTGVLAIQRLLDALSDKVDELSARLEPAELVRLAAQLERIVALLQGPAFPRVWQEGAAA